MLQADDLVGQGGERRYAWANAVASVCGFGRSARDVMVMATVHIIMVYPVHSHQSTCGLVAMTSASHAEGRQFDPGQVYASCCKLLQAVQTVVSSDTWPTATLLLRRVKHPTQARGLKRALSMSWSWQQLRAPVV